MDNPYKSFNCKIAGVTFENEDGSLRQSFVKRLKIGETLVLEREPNNQYDKNAVKVLNQKGMQLGYLSSHVAEEVGPFIDDNGTVTATVNELREGKYKNEKKYECNIRLSLYLANTYNEKNKLNVKKEKPLLSSNPLNKLLLSKVSLILFGILFTLFTLSFLLVDVLVGFIIGGVSVFFMIKLKKSRNRMLEELKTEKTKSVSA